MMPGSPTRPSGLATLLKPYAPLIAAIIVLTVLANGLNLVVPRLISTAIDNYAQRQLVPTPWTFLLVAAGIFVFTYLQSIAQTYAAERVAKDLRTQLIAKIASQNYKYIEQVTSAKLLTHLTSDVDAVKMFVSQAMASLVSSVFLIIGASILLLLIDWKLALAVLAVLPVIGVTFMLVLRRVRKLFTKTQEAIDWLNKVINESILGSALIRLLNSQQAESEKFIAANTEARDLSLSILRMFAGLIPVIMFATNVATVVILLMGGRFVITGAMTLGNFTAFNSYLSILIFPVIMIGFMSNIMAQASASFGRLSTVLDAPQVAPGGLVVAELRGDIALRHVNLTLAGKVVLRDVSLLAHAGTRTAVMGPTAAGKTQLLYLLAGLLNPDSGAVEYDGRQINEYDEDALHRQIAFVFQNSVLFNLSLRENIAFSKTVTDADVEKAIGAAELTNFVNALPAGLETIVSERGASLSGGQQQRIMLARALALNPKVLLLDDFTARVDLTTARKILANVHNSYPGITLLSVTQQIAPVEDYDQVVLLMEGEVLAAGTHRQLLERSPEYVQIYESQRSTSHYELRA
jgi:ATP-binding cassette subfamily B protein